MCVAGLLQPLGARGECAVCWTTKGSMDAAGGGSNGAS